MFRCSLFDAWMDYSYNVVKLVVKGPKTKQSWTTRSKVYFHFEHIPG